MKVELQGEYLERYKKLYNERRCLTMPDKRVPTRRPRIKTCHLTPRQKIKFGEMMTSE